MVVMPPGFLTAARSALHASTTVLLLADEVATGFGRTGEMFACEHERRRSGSSWLLGKGLTGGYLPVAATLIDGRDLRRVLWRLRRAAGRSTTATRSPGTSSGCCGRAREPRPLRARTQLVEHVPPLAPGQSRRRLEPIAALPACRRRAAARSDGRDRALPAGDWRDRDRRSASARGRASSGCSRVHSATS